MNRNISGIGLLRRKRTGQTTCNGCNKVYNNRSVPPNCVDCQYYLGGKHIAQCVKSDALRINETMMSVRVNERGIDIRSFITLAGNKKKVSQVNFIALKIADFGY